jgi:hypothetical protein
MRLMFEIQHCNETMERVSGLIMTRTSRSHDTAEVWEWPLACMSFISEREWEWVLSSVAECVVGAGNRGEKRGKIVELSVRTS